MYIFPLRSCGLKSSHARGNIIQQHLLKPDPQLLSQVKDGPSVLTTMAQTFVVACPRTPPPPPTPSRPVCPAGPLTRLIHRSVQVEDASVTAPFLSFSIADVLAHHSSVYRTKPQPPRNPPPPPPPPICVAVGCILMQIPFLGKRLPSCIVNSACAAHTALVHLLFPAAAPLQPPERLSECSDHS